MKITKLAEEVLQSVCDSPSGHSSFDDLAYLLMTTNQAIGRVVRTLSAHGLVTRQRFTKDWEIWPTQEGKSLINSRK